MAHSDTVLQIPDSLKPADGRFGSGPSRIRPQQIGRLAQDGGAIMGTSHRRAPVRGLVAQMRARETRTYSLNSVSIQSMFARSSRPTTST